MGMHRVLVEQGHWLFRRRSYIPLLFIPLVVLALRQGELLEHWLGDGVEPVWTAVCLGISLAGLVGRALVAGYAPAGTSGRNTRAQQAASLTTTGLYSVVRHPLYVANFLMLVGATLLAESVWMPPLVWLAYCFYYERIILAEEDFLRTRFPDTFESWSRRVPAVWPRWSGWVRPALPFSWRAAVAREHSTVLVIVVAFAVVDYLSDGLGEGDWDIDPPWALAVLLTAAVSLTVRLIKRRTQLLYEPGY